ncbi:SusD/RagB family nutrient-binding outer membrane lipoprotein [Chitinophaga solisilvae]|uniref:SusD/RagB family nutrient-binding outer membrane lipoprotein n=1 Tax=Chitinophaga solisilvae TaxID=1233460 RepID=UPI00136D687E|nr:SusD/RagB family nutrient-binding outer membrane lipoprotein [Chitinophaga solisilvae]
MRRLYIAASLICTALLGVTGCKKFLDVNTDPNNPISVSEKLILPPVILTTTTQVVGGYNGTVAAFWTQQLSLNQEAPHLESYRIVSNDVDNTWTFFIYPNALKNLQVMMDQAASVGHNEYVAIGKTLTAFNLAILTDVWGSVPYSEAFKVPENIKPKYDSQESIYRNIQQLLDEALVALDKPASGIKPGNDDLIYQGDMAKWKSFIYTLKARFYLRLSNAPGRTPALQADSALKALAKGGFTSNGQNASVQYQNAAQKENPWFKNAESGQGGLVMGQTFINFLKATADPRLPIISTTDASGVNYVGKMNGAKTVGDYMTLSRINSFYGSEGSALYLTTYAEALFIKAEATFIMSGAAAAEPIYKEAIAAHMNMLGVATGAAQAYINSRPALTAANALEQIIYEKYVANFLSIETYNDWRRTGFPKLSLAENAFVNYIPRRWPYPSNEEIANPQPEHKSTSIATRVWWDTK